MRKEIKDIICEVLEDLKNDIDDNETFIINDDTVLMGSQSFLNSLNVVNLIVNVEELVEEQFDVSIVLADEKAMSRKNSPFKTVKTLTEYVYELIQEGNEDD